MRYIHLSIILVAVYLPQYAVWALPTLAGINLLFAVMFYSLCFSLLAGLKSSGINEEMIVTDTWSSRVIQAVSATILLMSGDFWFVAIGIFTLPWIIINIVTDAFATLVKWEVLEISDKE